MSNAQRHQENDVSDIPPPGVRLAGRAFGLDIGGSGVKGAIVDVTGGRLVTARIREPTPRAATRGRLLDVISDVVRQIEATGQLKEGLPGGVGFPSVVKAGRALTATQLDEWWVGSPVEKVLSERLGRPVVVLNDADAAGVAEVAYGAGKDRRGLVLLLTLGTGIGTSLFMDGNLVPNLQLGHVEFHRRDAETRLSSAARERRKLSLKKWAREFNELLADYETYLWPDLIILGGGMARKFPKFERFLHTRAPLVAGSLGNVAGIIGAARTGLFASTRTVARPPSELASPRS